MALTMNDIYEILKNEGGRTPSEKVMEVSNDYPEKIAMRYKEFGIWQETTYRDFWLKSNFYCIHIPSKKFLVHDGYVVLLMQI